MKSVVALILSLCFAVPAWAAPAAHHEVQVQLDPAMSTVVVKDQISVHGQGPTPFTLSAAFSITSLSVDGQTQAPTHMQGRLVIDLGSMGPHEISIATKATLAQKKQVPFLTAQGGYLGSNWLAHPVDRLATWTLNGQSPKGQKWLTEGRLVSESDTDTGYRARFRSTDHPSAPPTLITGPFKISERLDGDLRVRTYFHPELAPLAQGYLDDTVGYIQDASTTIGAFPYPGFSIVSGPMPVGFGLPGMTYMGRRVLALPFIRTTSLPHEVLHNWWGNAVEVDYASGNWAEGLTTFQADLVQSARRNGDDGRAKRLEWLRNYAALPATSDQALSDFTSRTHDASQIVGYGKTAFVFHMLKNHLGKDTFTRSLQRFYRINAYKTASWLDLKTAFETVSGADLSAFFNAWTTKPGAPNIKLMDAIASGSKVTFSLNQSPAYPLDIPVHIHTQSGDQTLSVRLNAPSQTFTLTAKDTVLGVSIDPNFNVFRRLAVGEMPPIFRDVTLDPDTQLVLVSQNPEVNNLAQQLAEHLLQRPAQPQTAARTAGPRLIIGLDSDIAPYLQGTPPPASDGRAYVMRDALGRATLFIMATDTHTLVGLGKVLAHYKRRSFVTFKAGKITDKGVSPVPASPLARTFNANGS